jgi:hypothetical protein
MVWLRPRISWEKSVIMMDLIFVIVTLGFFLVSIVYVYACDRLR